MIHAIDWWIIGIYIAITVSVGLYFSKRASRSMKDFFISGRSLPWWLAGTSIVATSFAADTPLAVTEMVWRNGIAGNWYWWAFVIQGLMVTFLFSKLWRRAEILTDVEFFELRYSGKSAAFLRAFKAFIGAFVANTIIMGWVMLAMATVMELVLGWPAWQSLGLCVVIALVYSVASGLWGVVVTDFLQFGMAMIGSIVLAFFAIDKVGGVVELKQRIVETTGSSQPLDFIPTSGSDLFVTFLVYLGIQWWCASNSDSGGGIIVQRLSATRTPRDSMLAILWFNIAHYCLRAWPWIMTALAIVVLYPGLDNPKIGYPRIMLDILPTGIKGLMLASFIAAFMSTVDTQLNWASSYLVNDIYKRFLKRKASERHYVLIGRISMVLVAIMAALGASQMSSIEKAWKFWTLMGAGAGLVKIARWFWWRINAWSEISAMVSSLTFSTLIMKFIKCSYGERLLLNVVASGCVWVTVTFLTSPTDMKKLSVFFRKVRPPKFLWGPVARQNPDVTPAENFSQNILAWIIAVIFIYATLFATGKLLLLEYHKGVLAGVIAVVSGILLFKVLGLLKKHEKKSDT